MHAKRWLVFILAGSILFGFIAAAMAAERKPKNKGPVSVAIQAPVEKVKSALVARLVSRGFEVESDGKYLMVFSKDTQGVMREFAARLALGGNYADKPRILLRFTFLESESGTEVTGRQDLTTRNSFGATNRMSLDGGKARKGFLEFLRNVKYDAEYAALDEKAKSIEAAEPVKIADQ